MELRAFLDPETASELMEWSRNMQRAEKRAAEQERIRKARIEGAKRREQERLRKAKEIQAEGAPQAAREACGRARPFIDYHKAGSVWQAVWEVQGGLPSLGKDQ